MKQQYSLFNAVLFFLLLFAVLFGSISCSQEEPKKKTYPAKVKVFYKTEGNPGKGIDVVLFPKDVSVRHEKWSNGFPRGRAGEDGWVIFSTYEEGDGAPIGEYYLMARWIEDEKDDTDGTLDDLLQGRYFDLENPGPTVKITEGNNELEPFLIEG